MHYHNRHLESEIRESLAFYKAILLIGARQVGKTTLLRHVFPDFKIITFDPVLDIMQARSNPDLFLESIGTPVILDEVQYVPELFPALKRRMDDQGITGQYVLTGSQNPMLLKQVAESMAGRVAIYELESYSVQERFIADPVKTPWISRFIENGCDWKLMPQLSSQSFDESLMEVLWRGSLPDAVRLPLRQVGRYHASYILTYLERDVRIAGHVEDIEKFSRFLALCAALSGQVVNRAQLGREIGIAPATAEKWLAILKATFQWHELAPWKGNTIKRISGKAKGLFSDTGLVSHLLRLSSPEAVLAAPQRGAMFETFVGNEIRKSLLGFAGTVGHYHWRTDAGAEVDNVLEVNGRLHPFEVKCKDNLNAYDMRGIRAFRETYGDAAGDGAIIYAGRNAYKLDEKTWAVPWTAA